MEQSLPLAGLTVPRVPATSPCAYQAVCKAFRKEAGQRCETCRRNRMTREATAREKLREELREELRREVRAELEAELREELRAGQRGDKGHGGDGHPGHPGGRQGAAGRRAAVLG